MSHKTIQNIFIIASSTVGVLVFLSILAVGPGAAIVFAMICGAFFYAYSIPFRKARKEQVGIVAYRVQKLRHTMWMPLENEFSEVIAVNGAVTDAASIWTNMTDLSKQDAGAQFVKGMENYVNWRERVATLVAIDATEAQLEPAQQRLASLSRELYEQAREARQAIPVWSVPSKDIPSEALRPPSPTSAGTNQGSSDLARAVSGKVQTNLAALRIADPPKVFLVPQVATKFAASTAKTTEMPRPGMTLKPPVEVPVV